MVEETVNKGELNSKESEIKHYNYFDICHHFVRKIKLFNELQSLSKINPTGFS